MTDMTHAKTPKHSDEEVSHEAHAAIPLPSGRRMRSVGFWILVVFAAMYGLVNARSSQLVHPLYFSFINEDRQAVVTFLEKTRDLPVYPEVTSYLSRSIEVLKEDILRQDRAREQTIGELEKVLEQNENARDVLVALALLHKENGNTAEYEYYLNRAKNVDPRVEL